MKKKKGKKPEYIEYEDGTRVLLDDDDVPELTEEDFKQMRPFKEMHPELYASWQRTRGRPRKRPSARKISIHLRLDPDIAKRLRATGRGWQTRLNAAIRVMMMEHRV